jgi:type VI secretion system protein ImpE
MSATPEALLAAGDPAAALAALQQLVRSRAGDARLRVFLFQLLCVLGQWKRALDQLKICGELDASTLAMVATYESAVQCEAVREAVFAGRVRPHLFGPPSAWVAQLVQALETEAQGQLEAATAMRTQAFELAPAAGGQLTLRSQADAPHRFAWCADADSRLGPVLEVIVNGRYGWLPFEHLAAVELEPVEDLRDLVWIPAHLRFVNGGDTIALLPVRYAGTPLAENAAAALSRCTEWVALSDSQYRGIGQRQFCTDTTECGLLEMHSLQFDVPSPNAG